MFDKSKIRSKLFGNKDSKDGVKFITSIKTLLEMEQDLVIEYNEYLKSVMDYKDEIAECKKLLASKPELASKISNLNGLANVSKKLANGTYKEIKEIRRAIHKALHV